MSYYSSSFEYCSQINDHSVINEMNVSLNITYDFELDNLNWFMTGSERNAETEQNIVNILMSLLELSDYDIQEIQDDLLRLQNQFSNALSLELTNYCK